LGLSPDIYHTGLVKADTLNITGSIREVHWQNGIRESVHFDASRQLQFAPCLEEGNGYQPEQK
jgi:hypothetical protein